VSARFCKTVLPRFSKRVAKRVKVESLSGRPGIVGGPWRRLKDKNVKGVTKGKYLSDLRAVNSVSKVLRTHVEGATITARGVKGLFLRTGKHGKGTGSIFARVKSVTIPARVKFEEPWRQEIPRAQKETADALHRAMMLSFEQRMKVVSQYLNKVASHS